MARGMKLDSAVEPQARSALQPQVNEVHSLPKKLPRTIQMGHKGTKGRHLETEISTPSKKFLEKNCKLECTLEEN